EQPRVRKRTCFIIGVSPSRSGRRSSSTMISAPSRSTTGRSLAKYSDGTGMFSRKMYSHTSSSVQLEIGNTRTDSPLWMRVLGGGRGAGRVGRGARGAGGGGGRGRGAGAGARRPRAPARGAARAAAPCRPPPPPGPGGAGGGGGTPPPSLIAPVFSLVLV